MINFENIGLVYKLAMPSVEVRRKAISDAHREVLGQKSRVAVLVGLKGMEKALMMAPEDFEAFKRGFLGDAA